MKPYFSIIIPVYNVAPYLRECLDSVLAQTFTDWEAICVDDGSTDESGAILDEYAEKDSRFKVIHQQNAGVSAARNFGLDKISGEWVLFLDGDDVWSSQLLANVQSMIENYPTEKLFRFGFKKFVDGRGAALFKEGEEGDCCVIDISKEISMHDFFFYYFVCYVYRKDLLEDVRFPNYIRGEDRCVLNRIQLERVDSIVATDVVLYGYRAREGSAMNVVPSVQVLCDEMDHRLDIIEMIDVSKKKVIYRGNSWLEKYFTEQFYHIVEVLRAERAQVVLDWRVRLRRLHSAKGLSLYGKFVARTCSIMHLKVVDALLCYFIPRLKAGGSPIRALRRMLRK